MLLRVLSLDFSYSEFRKLRSATDAEILPKAKPWAVSQHLIVPPICSRYIIWAEWPYIRSFEHLFELLDFINDAFNVHLLTV